MTVIGDVSRHVMGCDRLPDGPPANDRAALAEIRAHLGAAIAQSVALDDQIIMGHVRAAYRAAGGEA